MAKVLIIGDRGREHSLGWKIAQSPHVEKIYFAPGTGGSSKLGENVDISMTDLDKLADFAKTNKIDLTVVGAELPLVSGIGDRFTKDGLAIFGPSAAAAQIEASKAFAADFMHRHNIPQPQSQTVHTLKDALNYIKDKSPTDYVIKASGLAGGKGVIVPQTQAEAKAALTDIMEKKVFGEAGDEVVFQERLYGQEVSAFALSDGKDVAMLPFFQDHKQIFDGDKGPNTGGIGAFSPVSFVTPTLAKRVRDEIMQPAIDGLRKDGTPYKGVLYAGLFITKQGEPKVIEFNCRFGDPECEPMMLAIDEDLYPLLFQSAQGQLAPRPVKIKSGAVACVVLNSKGYPGSYPTGYPIYGLDSLSDPNVVVFHSGTKLVNGSLVTNGGRVLVVTAHGKDLNSTLKSIYDQIGPKVIHFKDMHYRTDIGRRPAA